MNVDYDYIQKSIDEYGKYIMSCIQNKYFDSLSNEQLNNIKSLLNQKSFIVIEKPNPKDLEFFSKQEGIINQKDYSYEYVPSAHGGRTKKDNKIHIYPYTKSFENCKTSNEIVKTCIDDILIHEIFHYFIRPNISNQNETLKNEFGHFLTEGLVQYYTEEFAKQNRLGTPHSNYTKNLNFAKELINGFPKEFNQTQINQSIFSLNQEELLDLSKNGKKLYSKYLLDIEYHKEITNLIIKCSKENNINIEESDLQKIIKHFEKEANTKIIKNELESNLKLVFKDNPKIMEKYINELNSLESRHLLNLEMENYLERMRIVLPIEEEMKQLQSSGKSKEEITKILGNNITFLNSVPKTLYHGSPDNLDIIKSKESTQEGSYVYATDNPVHALFFSIFRNSSEVRAHIKEYIDENGEYKVKYEIDERIPGSLEQIISDKNVTIHICDGEDFFKKQGEAYINREWCSKYGKDIKPINKIDVNVKDFFSDLEKQGIVEYNKYNKEKDWVTVIDLVTQNYPFGLGTKRGKDLSKFDSMYDQFIATNFSEQYEFSKYIRNDIKQIMKTNFRTEDTKMSKEEEQNYKLKMIKNYATNFLKSDQNGKMIGDINKINKYLESQEINQISEEKGKSL